MQKNPEWHHSCHKYSVRKQCQVIEDQKYWPLHPNLNLLLWCSNLLLQYTEVCTVFSYELILVISSPLAANFISFTWHKSCTRGAISIAINALKWLHNSVPGINQTNDPVNEKILKMVVDSALRNLPKRANLIMPLSHDFIHKVLTNSESKFSLIDIRDSLILSLAYTLLSAMTK